MLKHLHSTFYILHLQVIFSCQLEDGNIRRNHLPRHAQSAPTNRDLNEKLSFISRVFSSISGYPKRIIDQCQNKVKAKFSRTNSAVNEGTILQEAPENQNEEPKQPYTMVPCEGKRGEKVMKRITNRLPEKLRPRIVYTGTKLSTFTTCLTDPAGSNPEPKKALRV